MAENSQKLTYYQKNRDAILLRSKKKFEDNKEERKEYQRNRFHNMTNEQRDKTNKYRRLWYCKLDEEKKNKIRKDARDRYYLVKGY